LQRRCKCVNAGGVAYTWSDAGRLLNDGTYTYTLRAEPTRLSLSQAQDEAYDALYRLTEADYRSTGLTTGSSGEAFTYTCDAVSNRTAYTATVTQTTVTTYTYDAANRPCQIK
jgi:hypothetical protein